MASSSATATSVYFIRHGTSEWNLLKRWQGQTDTLLAPEGEEQARLAGEALSARGVSFDAVRCSDLKRAARTAALLAAGHAETDVHAVVVLRDAADERVVDELLRERLARAVAGRVGARVQPREAVGAGEHADVLVEVRGSLVLLGAAVVVVVVLV